jgi:hypothetical protein
MHVQHLQQKTWKPNRSGSAEYAQVPASPSSPLLSDCQATRDCGLGEAKISSLGAIDRPVPASALVKAKGRPPASRDGNVKGSPTESRRRLRQTCPLAGRFLSLVVINRLGRSDTAKTRCSLLCLFPALASGSPGPGHGPDQWRVRPDVVVLPMVVVTSTGFRRSLL